MSAGQESRLAKNLRVRTSAWARHSGDSGPSSVLDVKRHRAAQHSTCTRRLAGSSCDRLRPLCLLVLVAGARPWDSHGCSGDVQVPLRSSLRGGDGDSAAKLHAVLARRAAAIGVHPVLPAATCQAVNQGLPDLKAVRAEAGRTEVNTEAGCSRRAADYDYVTPSVPHHAGSYSEAAGHVGWGEDGAQKPAPSTVRETGKENFVGKRQMRTWEQRLEDVLGPSPEEIAERRLAKARKALSVSCMSIL